MIKIKLIILLFYAGGLLMAFAGRKLYDEGSFWGVDALLVIGGFLISYISSWWIGDLLK